MIAWKVEAADAVFTVFRKLVRLVDPQDFEQIVRAYHVLWMGDVAQLVADQTVGERVPGTGIDAKLRAPVVPGKEGAVMAQNAREAGHEVAGMGQSQHARDDEGEIGFLLSTITRVIN